MKTTITIDIKVVPQSGKQEISTDKSGTIKCLLKSPPEKGKANRELIKLLSRKLKLPQENIVIIKGQTSRKKTIKIQGEGRLEEILTKLGIELQMKI